MVRYNPDDTVRSWSSLSRELHSSVRSRKNCSLRQHAVESKLAPALQNLAREECAQEKPKERWNKSFHNYRFVMVTFGGLAIGLMIFLRYSMAVSILNMVNQTALYLDEHPGKTVDDYVAEGFSVTQGEFHWNHEIQQIILSWYMISYTLPQVSATKWGVVLGIRFVVPIFLGLSAISTMLIPTFAYWGWEWVVFLRMLNGLGACPVVPLMLTLIEDWMPFEEISLGITVAQVLQALLVASNPLVSGYICAIHWKYVFYVSGSVTLLFCLIWPIFVTDKPDESPFISQKELDLICGCSENASRNGDADKKHEHGKSSPASMISQEDRPGIRDVLKVPSFYAFLIVWTLYCIAGGAITFSLPTYVRQFLKVSIANNGSYCFLIQSGSIIAVFWPHFMFKFLQGKIKLTTITSRRVTFGLICFSMSSMYILVAGFHRFQIVLLFIAYCFLESNEVVVQASIMSNYAKNGLSSIVFSMVNAFGNLLIVVTCTVIGKMLDSMNQSNLCWSLIFLAMGSCHIMMFVVFFLSIRFDSIEFDKKSEQQKQILDDIEAIGQQVSDEKKTGIVSLTNQFDKPFTEINLGRNESKDRLA